MPTIGDVLTFASGSNQTTLNNDLSPSPPLGGVIVTNGNYQIQGNGLTLASDSQSQIERDFKVDTLLGGGVITILNQTSFVVGSQGQSTPVTPTTFSGRITGSKAIFEKDGPGAFTFTGDASGVQETRVTQGNFDLVGGSLSTVFVTGPNETFAMSNNAHVGFLNVRNNGEIGDPLAGVAMTGDIQMEDMSYVQTISANGGMKLVATGTVKLSFNGNSVLTIISGNYTPPPGSVIIMVQNDGTDAVDGVFRAGNGLKLEEGAIITIGGAPFRLSYRCNAEASPARCANPGDGNDIGLVSTQIATPPPDLTITKTHTGNFTQGQTRRDLHDHGDQLRERADDGRDHGHRHPAQRTHGHDALRDGLGLHVVDTDVHARRRPRRERQFSTADADGHGREQRARERHQHGDGLGRRRDQYRRTTRRRT